MILIIKTTKIQVLKMLLPRLLTVQRLLLRMHPQGNKHLGYPLLLHPKDEEGQRLFLPRLLLPIIDAILRPTIPLFCGPGIDSVRILLRILLSTELGM